MNAIKLNTSGLVLLKPNPERDAPFAVTWFQSPQGRDTLLRMGNTDDQIVASTLEGELKTLRSFVELEKANRQITWMLRYDNKTIGAVWIELEATEYLPAPAVHIMIGDPESRGKGIGKDVMRGMIDYARDVLKVEYLYSRHLVTNDIISSVNRAIGLHPHGPQYSDENGLVWQNVRTNV